MKKQILIGVALATLVAGADLCQAAGLTFSKVIPTQKENIMTWDSSGYMALSEAIKVHNLMVDVNAIKDLKRQLDVTTQMRELEEKQLQAMEKCNLDKLAEQFKNPKEVWDKMNAEYDKKEKELTIYVNSTETPSPEEEEAFLNYMQTGKMTPEMVVEQYEPWRIGQEILIDVYQNQDKWGERKNQKSPSFPLWQDQKFQYDQEWNDYYTKLNDYFGAPSAGRPNIGNEKYDYAQYETVQKAHQKYVDTLKEKNPKKAKALKAEFNNPPKAPKPLPPKDEIVVYFETDTKEASVYPNLPEPWQKYAENGFKNRDPKGEMAADFKEGLILKEEVKNEQQINRVVAFANQRQMVDNMNVIENLSLNDGGGVLGKVYDKLEKYMELEPKDNLLDEKTRKEVLKRLDKKKEELLAIAEKDLLNNMQDKEKMAPFINLEDSEDFAELKKINPKAFEQIKKRVPVSVYDQNKNVLNALKKDKEGRVYIDEVNAGDIDTLLKEEKARRAYVEGQNDLEKRLDEKARVKIDDTCLNGGI